MMNSEYIPSHTLHDGLSPAPLKTLTLLSSVYVDSYACREGKGIGKVFRGFGLTS